MPNRYTLIRCLLIILHCMFRKKNVNRLFGRDPGSNPWLLQCQRLRQSLTNEQYILQSCAPILVPYCKGYTQSTERDIPMMQNYPNSSNWSNTHKFFELIALIRYSSYRFAHSISSLNSKVYKHFIWQTATCPTTNSSVCVTICQPSACWISVIPMFRTKG